jgi:hypothetical protein
MASLRCVMCCVSVGGGVALSGLSHHSGMATVALHTPHVRPTDIHIYLPPHLPPPGTDSACVCVCVCVCVCLVLWCYVRPVVTTATRLAGRPFKSGHASSASDGETAPPPLPICSEPCPPLTCAMVSCYGVVLFCHGVGVGGRRERVRLRQYVHR